VIYGRSDCFGYALDSSAAACVSGTPPAITVNAGTTVVLQINSVASHPVVINVAPGGSAFSGATPASPVTVGTITIVVPASGVTTLYYECSVHGFFGVINVIGSTTAVSSSTASTTSTTAGTSTTTGTDTTSTTATTLSSTAIGTSTTTGGGGTTTSSSSTARTASGASHVSPTLFTMVVALFMAICGAKIMA